MMRLIVNADDLGAGRETDRGIIESFDKGMVTSASLLPNGPSFVSATRMALRTGIPVGVHLNLSEGSALSGPISGLTDEAGTFPGKEELRRILTEGHPDPEGLYREMAAQMERVFDAGLCPDHIDSHQHFFLFPAVTGMVLEVARFFSVNILRLPMPVETDRDTPAPLGREIALYRRLAPAAARTLRNGGFLSPEGLLGMPFLNLLDEDRLLRLMEEIPAGTWELMVHPGYPDPVNPFSAPQRQRELTALTSSQVCRTVRALGIDLITFGDLSCAS